MARYGYKCLDCGNEFEIELSIKQYDRHKKQACNQCQGSNVNRMVELASVHFGRGFFKDGYQSAKNIKTSTSETSDDGD
jgi:putative FmdB family regulatory protein